jgi:hypothetical protein
LDEESGSVGDDVPLCLGGRGAAPPEIWRSYRQILKEGFESIDRRLQEYGPLEPERFHLEEANQRLARRQDLMRWRHA